MDFESADTAADVDSNALCVFARNLKTRGGERIVSGRDTHLDKTAHLFYFFLFQ